MFFCLCCVYLLTLMSWLLCRRTNRGPWCPLISNPSTSPWTDITGSWWCDNRLAAQHLTRDLMRPTEAGSMDEECLLHGFLLHNLIVTGPFRVNSQEVVKSPSLIFLKFYSNCHYPIWWTSVKFEWNLSRNDMIIKLFSWRCFSRGSANCSYLAMFKALLLPNYISEQAQFFRDASNFAKYWKK